MMYLVSKVIRKLIGMPAIKNTEMEEHTKVDVFSTVVGSSMGKCSYIGEHSSVIFTDIGRFCSISNYCAIGGGSHPTDWVSSSPVFNSSTSILHFNIGELEYNPFNRTTIQHDVWIGSHCLIKSGVTIGIGAVVGMGSVVTKDIGPYEIWAGNPAHLIRKRFDDETIERLLASHWWEWSEEKLAERASLVNSVGDFLEKELHG